MDTGKFEDRKREHIRLSLDASYQARGASGLDRVHLVHEALPELNLAEIRLVAPCLGRVLPTPFYVAGMTAGHPDAFEVNRSLAIACQRRGWAMGVGSQRRDLEGAEGGLLDSWERLRKEVPDLMLFANLGISQIISTKISNLEDLVKRLGAQALVVHLNALQEAIQPEGTPHFRGGLNALKQVCLELGVPLVLKETGCGFSQSTLERIAGLRVGQGPSLNRGLAAVDVSGLGGTHWGRIEGARAGVQTIQAKASQSFANWGESTVESVRAAALALPEPVEVWASGGVRSGLDAAKLIALGAHRVGYAQPALEAVLAGPEQLEFWMETQEFELKVALFVTGAGDCRTLRQKDGLWKLNIV